MNVRRFENIHIAFWLLKDFSWCSNWKWFGTAMVLPTLVVAGRIMCSPERKPADLVHNIAVCFWAVANVTWMTGEFFFQDKARGLAQVFFTVGIAVLAVYYTVTGMHWCVSRRSVPTPGCDRRRPS